MSETICGHERETVKAVLRSFKEYESFGYKSTPTPRQFYLTCADPSWSVEDTEAIRRDASDPTKLAEMLAEEARRLGFNIYDDDPGDDFALPYADVLDRNGGVCILVATTWTQLRDGSDEYQISLGDARAILATWINLPDGARVEAEKILRGER